MVELIHDPDFGWIAVDNLVDLNYDEDTQAIIDKAALDQGVAGRDPGMDYRPTLDTTGGETTADFTGTLGTPMITLENLSKNLDALRSAGHPLVSADTRAFMQNIQDEARNEQMKTALATGGGGFNPIMAALEAQQASIAAAEDDPIFQQMAQYGAVYDKPVVETPVVETPVVEPPTEEPPAEEPPAEQPPAVGQSFEERLKEANDFLDQGNVLGNWDVVFADLAKDATNPNQMWDLANKLAKNISAAGTETFTSQKEQFDMLKNLYDSYGPEQVGWINFAENSGFNMDAYLSSIVGDLGSFSLETAGAAADKPGQTLDGFIIDMFTSAMTGGGHTWRSALDAISEIVFAQKGNWDKYPGLSGQASALQSVDDVANWIYQTYNRELTPKQRTDLEGKYGVGTYAMSNTDFFERTTDVSPWAPTAAVPETPADKSTITVYRTNTDGSTVSKEIDPTELNQNFQDGWNTTPTGTPGRTADGVQIPQGTGQIPWAQGQAPGSPLYDPFTAVDERRFAQEYPGFARSQPGYRMPAIQSAYTRAGAPLQTQYGLQVPNLLMSGEAGLGDPKYQSAADWLRGLTGGTGQILRGAELYGALQNVSTALTADPNVLGLDPRGDLWRKYFETPEQQAAAYAQPFLMATRGAPEARSALTEAISDAAARFEYENPAGVLGASGQRQGFLPWALEQNLLGINQMFAPETRRAIADPETAKLASQAGVPMEGFWDRPASETGAWY